MKIITLNVNGMYNAIQNGLISYILESDADIICLQEIRTNKNILSAFEDLKKYYIQINPSSSKSNQWGTAVLMKMQPNYYKAELDGYLDEEGRTQIISLPRLFILNCYAPQAGAYLENLSKKIHYMKHLKEHILKLMRNAPILIIGDLNIFHECGRKWEYPIQRPGRTPEETTAFRELMANGLVDLVEKNIDRSSLSKISKTSLQDHLIISSALERCVKKVSINTELNCSNHLPLELELELPSRKNR